MIGTATHHCTANAALSGRGRACVVVNNFRTNNSSNNASLPQAGD